MSNITFDPKRRAWRRIRFNVALLSLLTLPATVLCTWRLFEHRWFMLVPLATNITAGGLTASSIRRDYRITKKSEG